MRILAALVIMLAAVVACGVALPPPSDQADVGVYEAEQLECVATVPADASFARDTIDQCRCAVKVKHHRKPCDGGAP